MKQNENFLLSNDVMPEDYLGPSLTADQADVFVGLLDWFKSPGKNMALLSAYAGSGKTFLVRELVRYMTSTYTKAQILNFAFDGYRPSGPVCEIAVSAPTHKAVKVIRRSAGELPMTQYKTLASLLCLRPEIDRDTGAQVFKPDYALKNQKATYAFIIVDEASMVGEDMWKHLLAATRAGSKILFVGDEAQLPPVGEDRGAVFLESNRHMLTHFKLTTIVRQAKGSPILEMANDIRASKRVFAMSGHARDYRLPLVNEPDYSGFASEEYDMDVDSLKVLAWRNKTVADANKEIRRVRYGKAADKHVYMVGEVLTLKEPYEVKTKSGSYTIPNNTEVRVLKVELGVEACLECMIEGEVTEDNIAGEYPLDIKVYELTVENLDADEDGASSTFVMRVVHEDARSKYEGGLRLLNNVALSLRDAKSWEQYYAMKARFGQIEYAYAITVHRAQGSTYSTAIVMDWDIALNRNDPERKAMYYTAATRASKELVIVHNG